jgi:hypothetical protein
MAIEFAPGTPDAARRLFEDVLVTPNLDLRVRGATERLATYDAMSGLWRDTIPVEPL